MKLDMVGIITQDMKASQAFYECLGFQVQEQYGDNYLELDNDGVRISLNSVAMLESVYGHQPKLSGERIELAFLCDSKAAIHDTCHKLIEAGYTIYREPWSAPWGQYYALVCDPDGNILSLFVNEADTNHE